MTIQDAQLIVFDLDDTLAESKQPLSLEMGEALARLLEKKMVAVTSGARLEQFMQQFISGLPAETDFSKLILLPTSGAQYVVYENGEWISQYDHSFNNEEKEIIRNAFSEALTETGIAADIAETHGEQLEDRDAQITFSALGQEAPLDEKRAWDPDQEKRRKLVEVLTPLLPDMSIRIGGTTSVDVTQKGIDKAYGIEELSKRTGIPIAKMLYIGDALYAGGNDTPVLQTGIKTLQVSGPDEVLKLLEG